MKQIVLVFLVVVHLVFANSDAKVQQKIDSFSKQINAVEYFTFYYK
jgi:succinate dehydrogenase hydrophobic anchor subunit